jgi:hypothetical protein
MRMNRETPWIWGVGLVLPFVVFYWMVPFVTATTIGGDYAVFSIKDQLQTQFSLQHGSFPLYAYKEGHSAGVWTLGQLYHPLPHVAAALPGYWSGNALQLNTLFRLLSLGLTQVALLFFLKRLRFGTAEAFLLSFVTVYNLRMLDLFRYGASLENFTAHVLLCVAIGYYCLKPSKWIGVSMIAATYLAVTGGHPQMMYYALLGAALFTLAVPYFLPLLGEGLREPTSPVVLGFYRDVFVLVAIGVLLASAYIFPFYFDYLQDSAGRVGKDHLWSTGHGDTLAGTLNNFFSPFHSDVHGAFGGNFLLVLTLLVPVVRLWGVRVPRVVWASWLALLLILLFMLGTLTPVHHVIWTVLPLASSFRVPGRIGMMIPILTLLILGWLLCLTRSAPLNREGVARPLSALALGGVVVYLAYRFGFSRFLGAESELTPISIEAIPVAAQVAVEALGVISLLLLAAYAALPRRRRLLIAVLSGCVVLQGIVALRYGTWVEPRGPTPTFERMTAIKQRNLLHQPDLNRATNPTRVIEHVARGLVWEQRMAGFYNRYVSVPSVGDAYELLGSYHEPDTVVVEGFEPRDAPPPNRGRSSLALLYSSYNRLVFEVITDEPGFFVLAYPFSDRWQVRIDGGRALTYPANGIEQAVWVDRGAHEVEFRYASAAATAGMATSVATLALIFVFLAFRRPILGARVILAAVVVLGASAFFAKWHRSLHAGSDLGAQYAWDSSRLPDSENLALGRRAGASSVFAEQYSSDRAVDGDRRTAFRSAQRSAQSWQLDLGAVRSVQRVLVDQDRLAGRDGPSLIVDFSKDGKRFTNAYVVRGVSRPWTFLDIAPAPAVLEFLRSPLRTRHIRVRTHRTPAPPPSELRILPAEKRLEIAERDRIGFSLSEVEVYGPPLPR